MGQKNSFAGVFAFGALIECNHAKFKLHVDGLSYSLFWLTVVGQGCSPWRWLLKRGAVPIAGANSNHGLDW